MAFDTNPYYSVITIDHTLVGGALTDFILYLDDLPADAFAQIDSTGKDIRFSDGTGTTELAFDLRAIDTTAGTCEIMVKVPSVSAIVDTDIRIWYGDGTLSLYAATDTYGRNAVYSNFVAVFSMSEAATGATGSAIYIDRTGNGYDGKDYADATGKTGKVGSGQEFDGSNDYIEWSADWNATLPTTIMGWINLQSLLSSSGNILITDTWSTTYRGVSFQLIGSEILAIGFGDGRGTTPSDRKTRIGTTVLSTSTWYHVAGAAISTSPDLRVYVNGQDDGGSLSGGATSIASSTTPPTSGYDPWNSSNAINMFLDELWVANSDLGADFIETTYNNQNAAFGTFYTVGTRQDAPTGTVFIPVITWFT